MRYNKFRLRKKGRRKCKQQIGKGFWSKAARIYSAWAKTYR